MSTVTLSCSIGDLEVSTCYLREPVRGVWVAHLGLGWPEAPPVGSLATLKIQRTDGTIDTFAGAVRDAALIAASEDLHVDLLGGAGKLFDPIAAKHHTAGASAVPAGLVARGIVDAAGERLAAGVEAALDAYPLVRWTRAAGAAWDALDVLAQALGVGLRVLQDGSIWMGVETWAPVDASAAFVRGEPSDGMIEYSPDGAPYRPGTTIDGLRAVETSYRLTRTERACEVRGALRGDPLYAPALDLYRAAYPGTVRSQAADGTLDVACDDARIGELLGVQLRTGWPGVKVKIPHDTRCVVAFEAADPRGAYALGLDQDPNAMKSFSLVDDAVDCGTLGVTSTGGMVASLAYSPPGSPPPPGVPFALSGKITGPGHAYVKGVRHT